MIEQWKQERQTWPVLNIHLSNPPNGGQNQLGTGQLMLSVLRLHLLCRRLKRICYIQPYRSAASQYFGYADGSSWDVNTIEAIHNKNNSWRERIVVVSLAKSMVNAWYIETTLYHMLRNETAPLLRLHLAGVFSTRIPGSSSYPTGTTVAVHSSPKNALKLLRQEDPCYFRFVTQPRLRSRVQALPAAPVVMHLRTGYADADNRLIKSIPINRSATASWMEAACGTGPFNGNQARVALSDSPGVLRWLEERHGVKPGSSAALLAGNVTLTRTWGNQNFLRKTWFSTVEFAAFDDLLIAGSATTLYTAPQGYAQKRGIVHGTMFTVPALARSVCVESAALALPDCSLWPGVFVRDFRKAINFRDRPPKACKAKEAQCNGVSRWSTVYDMSGHKDTLDNTYTRLRNHSLIDEHPCKAEVDVASCYLWQVEALK